MIYLKDFSPVTAEWLRLNFEIASEPHFDSDKATRLLAQLKQEPDENFPRGKWATIQHLEYLIESDKGERPK